MSQIRNQVNKDEYQEKSLGTTLVAETLRSAAANREAIASPSKGEDNVSWFWKIFGGTILSIVALSVVTAYTQVSSSLTELRRDFNQMQEGRGNYLKKEEFSSRLTTMWNVIKELQTAQNAMATLNERAKLLDVQLDKQMRTGEDDRRELSRKIEEQRRALTDDHKDFQRRMEGLAERLALLEGRNAGSSSNAPKATPASTTAPLRKLAKPLTGS